MQMLNLMKRLHQINANSGQQINESLDECGIMGGDSSMERPKTPASINMTAASGDELGDLVRAIASLAQDKHEEETPLSSVPSIGMPSTDDLDMKQMKDRLNDLDSDELDVDDEKFKEMYGNQPTPEMGQLPPGTQDAAGTPGAAQGRRQMNNPVATPEEFVYECLRQDYQKFLANTELDEDWESKRYTGWQKDRERSFGYGAQDAPAPKTPAPDGYKWGIKNVFTKNWINDDDGVPMGWEYKEDAKDAMEKMSIDKGLEIYKHDITTFRPIGESVAEGVNGSRDFYDFANLYSNPDSRSHPDPMEAVRLITAQGKDPEVTAQNIISFAKSNPDEVGDPEYDLLANAVERLKTYVAQSQQGVAEVPDNQNNTSNAPMSAGPDDQEENPQEESLEDFFSKLRSEVEDGENVVDTFHDKVDQLPDALPAKVVKFLRYQSAEADSQQDDPDKMKRIMLDAIAKVEKKLGLKNTMEPGTQESQDILRLAGIR